MTQLRLLPVLLVAAAALLFGPAASARGLAKAWEATGFANPESVLWDPAQQVLYVSNVNGAPADKDGNGYISKLSADGHVLARKWVVGLDGPKGMAVHEGRLYVADIDRLVVIDTASGKLIKTYPADGAKFLGDVAAADDGVVYVSDMLSNSLWRLVDGRFEQWIADPALEAPNGLLAEHGRLVVATWGRTGAGVAGADTVAGSLKAVGTRDQSIRTLAPGLGSLAGVEPDGDGGYLVSDYVKGVVLQVARGGRVHTILTLSQGSADIGTIPAQHLLLVPMMMDGTVAAYRLK
jgi:DNA-binding beta-propeller fold protein YncE